MPDILCTSLNAEAGPHLELFREAGFRCEVVSRDPDIYIEDNLIQALRGYHAVLAGAEPYTRRVIESLPQLRAIARTGVGFDAIDLQACDQRRIVVCITPGVNHEAVAEHTMAMLMGVARGFPELDLQVRQGRWKRLARPRVMGSTLGLVGLGRIGQAVAWRALGLGIKVVACDPLAPPEFVEQWKIDLVTLDELLGRSDYVSLHLPMSGENRHLISAQTLAKMKPGAVLINTSRGPLVDEEALCDALQSGRLRGAALDVFEVEPLPADSPLLGLENVLLSGHVAGLDTQSHDDTFAMAARHILDLHRGRWPASCIVNLRGVKDWKW